MAKKDKAASSAPKTTIESMSDDNLYSTTAEFKDRYVVLAKAKKTAADALSEYVKIIKEAIGVNGLADIKDLVALGTPEGEALMKAEMQRKARVMKWMNIPIGSQVALFGDTDRTPITERAFNEGKRQGLAGEPIDNPHHHTTEAHRSHVAGFASGQETLATKGFSKLDPDVSADVKKSSAIGSSRPTYQVQ